MYIILANVMLIFWALVYFASERSNSVLRIKALKTSFSDLKSIIVPSVTIGLMSSSWRSEFVIQARLWRAQVWDYRRFLFSSSQGLLSFFWIILCFSVFFEISSYIFVLLALTLSAAGYAALAMGLNKNIFLKYTKTFSAFIFFTLILFFLELAFKNSSVLMQFLMESEIVFFTTIDSLFNLLSLLLVAAVIGFFIPIQGWSLVLTFLLFLNSQLSFLGFVFIVVGEFLGTLAYFYKTVRQWDKYYQKKIIGLLNWILAYLIVFLIFICFWKSMVSFGNVFNQIFMLKWIYIGTVIVFLAGLYMTIMGWGHFKSTVQDKEVMGSDSTLVKDFQSPEADEVLVFIKGQLGLRRDKLIQFKLELDRDPSSKGKIPLFVLNQFESEIAIIDKIGSCSD